MHVTAALYQSHSPLRIACYVTAQAPSVTISQGDDTLTISAEYSQLEEIAREMLRFCTLSRSAALPASPVVSAIAAD